MESLVYTDACVEPQTATLANTHWEERVACKHGATATSERTAQQGPLAKQCCLAGTLVVGSVQKYEMILMIVYKLSMILLYRSY